MDVKQLGPDISLLTTNHGDEVLYSHETALAGFSHKVGLFKASGNYNSTLTIFINIYLAGREALSLSSKQIEDMFL